MSSEKLIEWMDPASKRRVIIERLPSGHFRYYEEWFVVDDETADGGGVYEYWRPGSCSGLYPSMLDARNDAALELAWLGTLLGDVNRGCSTPP